MIHLSTSLLCCVVLLSSLCTPATVSAAETPRMGKYLIVSNGPTHTLNLGYLELVDATNYRYLAMGGKLLGEGTYQYNAASSELRWLSGPILENKWTGNFTVEREGKTHVIRLSRVVFAANSTDA